MSTVTRPYDLRVVNATPWAPVAPALARVKWRRVASDVCLFAGLAAFAVCMVTLRLSLFPQSVVSSRDAVLTTLAVGAAGIGAFFAAHRLHEAERNS
jgi:hypothetical protein